jgi:gliding motility-associated lipoprotein GldD
VLLKDKRDSCYCDISFPQYICNWHITLRDFKREKAGHRHSFEDYRRLIYNHTTKATEIRPYPVENEQGMGMYFEMFGEVPSPAQFFFTDTVKYAIMASIYFDTALRNDSLAPIIQRMRTDLRHLMQTIRWRSKSQ